MRRLSPGTTRFRKVCDLKRQPDENIQPLETLRSLNARSLIWPGRLDLENVAIISGSPWFPIEPKPLAACSWRPRTGRRREYPRFSCPTVAEAADERPMPLLGALPDSRNRSVAGLRAVRQGRHQKTEQADNSESPAQVVRQSVEHRTGRVLFHRIVERFQIEPSPQNKY